MQQGTSYLESLGHLFFGGVFEQSPTQAPRLETLGLKARTFTGLDSGSLLMANFNHLDALLSRIHEMQFLRGTDFTSYPLLDFLPGGE